MDANRKKILQIITNAPDDFIKQLSKTERDLYNKVLILVKELDIDSSGRIKASVANIKRLNGIRSELRKSLLSKKYISSVENFVRQFSIVSVLQLADFNIKKSAISKAITETAINNTIESLTGKGYADIIVNRLRDVIQTSITSGGSYKDLAAELERQIIGSEQKPGIVKKRFEMPVRDALSIYSAEHLKLITADLGYEWFEYVGSNIKTTREFCLHMTKKHYVHISEIPTLISGMIDGHQCKLGSNGLPLGMFEDTNEQNFETNRGGYNCRHLLYPVKKNNVPESIRIRFEK